MEAKLRDSAKVSARSVETMRMAVGFHRISIIAGPRKGVGRFASSLMEGRTCSPSAEKRPSLKQFLNYKIYKFEIVDFSLFSFYIACNATNPFFMAPS